MSGPKYTEVFLYENCVGVQAHWLLKSISNVWYECGFFQDFLEELKLVVRGSLFQVASLQDCFLQQSEPQAAPGTGVGFWAVCSPSSYRQTLGPPNGLGTITERWAGSRAVLQKVSIESRLLC